MNKIVLSEVLLILAISIIGIGQGIYLIFRRDPSVIYDSIGPGPYLFAVSIILLGGGAVHFILNRRKPLDQEKWGGSKELRIKLIGTALNCAVYIFLISIAGYLVSTVIFFLLQFRIEGIKSWVRNSILSLFISTTCYMVFVKYCSLIFPRGILFK